MKERRKRGLRKFHTRKLVEKLMKIDKMQHLEVIPKKYSNNQGFEKNEEKSLI